MPIMQVKVSVTMKTWRCNALLKEAFKLFRCQCYVSTAPAVDRKIISKVIKAKKKLYMLSVNWSLSSSVKEYLDLNDGKEKQSAW